METKVNEPIQPLLVSIKEVARLLDISPRSIRRRLSGGEMIEPIRIGGNIRWRLDEVKAWIDEGCPPTGTLDEQAGR